MPDHDYIAPDPHTRTLHVGSYRRVLPVSLERMYENTLDWEHLPHLHDSSFRSIECLDSGAWGWRAEVVDHKDQVSELELRLDRSRRRWITRNVSGPSEGAEIWTLVSPLAEHQIEIVVDFFVPGVPAEAREKVGRAYANAYTTLYDEDEAMMVARQRHLDQRVEGSRDAELLVGAVGELAERQVVAFRGREYVVCRDAQASSGLEDANAWLAFPALCPHQLGPLADADVVDGVVRCPWHGYQFDARTGANLSGQACRFTQVPELAVRDGQLYLVAT